MAASALDGQHAAVFCDAIPHDTQAEAAASAVGVLG